MQKPTIKPKYPYFSSGPCKKPSNWKFSSLKKALLGRSHRSKEAYKKINEAITLTAELLGVPQTYYIAIVPGSDTGAVEMAIWNLLGYKNVDILVYEHFAQEWLYDITQQLKLKDIRTFKTNFAQMPNLGNINFTNDFLFVLNGTTLGMALPNLDFIPSKREGLVICDASAAAFSRHLDFEKLDVITFSWQKSLGAEGGHGVIILSPKAIKRLENYNPVWAIPKIFRLKKQNGEVNYELFKGQLLNTPSMLCIEDYLTSLYWVKESGGVLNLIKKTENNVDIINKFVNQTNWIDFLIKDSQIRAKTTQTLVITDSDILALKLDDQKIFLQNIIEFLAENNVAFDISAYRKAPLGLRIWTGPTIDAEDLKIFCEWLKHAFFTEKAKIRYNE